MEKHTLSVSGLRLGYDGRVIVDGLDVTVPDGKISIIIGPTAAGNPRC